MRRARFFLAAAAAATLAFSIAPAGALDDTKPAACNGLGFEDPAGDNRSTVVPTPAVGTDAVGGFIKHDPAKGDEATTYNLLVKELSAEVPPGYTTLSWQLYYPGGAELGNWVRAVSDFGGGVSFEYGHIESAEATTFSLYDGETPGKLFEGPDGVVQLVLPKDQVTAGATLKPLYAVIGQGQASLPGATQAPVRGSTWVMDRAPDSEGAANKSQAVSPCPGGGGGATPTPTPGPTPPSGGGTGGTGGTGGGGTGGGSGGAPAAPAPQTVPAPTGKRALPVRLLTKSLRARKVRRVIKLKLRSSERLTSLTGQLRRGGKVVGKGRLRALNGKGTLKLKLAKSKKGKRVRKGTYVLDLVGSDARGARLLASYRLKIS